eukprot:6364511-Lingulodinium_polyedra.AAC.1
MTALRARHGGQSLHVRRRLAPAAAYNWETGKGTDRPLALHRAHCTVHTRGCVKWPRISALLLWQTTT